jgi:nucleotide-binding universal stress UspA family protein
MGRIITGLDRSGSHNDVILAAALAQARNTGWAVRIVHAIAPDAAATQPADVTSGAQPAARQSLDQAVAEDLRRHLLDATGDLNSPVTVDFEVRHGDPATVLLSAAQHADLIVIGTRGTHDGRSDRFPFMLGTVSQDIAVHATCPVLLIPTS